MNTPRDILLQRHRSTQPKLDAIRHSVLAEETPSTDAPLSPREMLRSLRWHLIGMSAVWLLILILRTDAGRAPVLAAAIPKPPSPQIMFASMREHRRLLSEMMDAHPSDSDRRELFLPQPHSEIHSGILVA